MVRSVASPVVTVLQAIRAKQGFVYPIVAYLLVRAATLAMVVVTPVDVAKVKCVTAVINVLKAAHVRMFVVMPNAVRSAGLRVAITTVPVELAWFATQVFVSMMVSVSRTVAIMPVM